MLPFAGDSLCSLEAVVPSSTMQDVNSHSNIFKVPAWSSGVLSEGSSSHTFRSRLPHMSFWGGMALAMVHLSWSLTVLVGCCRREPLYERVLLPLQVQVAGSQPEHHKLDPAKLQSIYHLVAVISGCPACLLHAHSAGKKHVSLSPCYVIMCFG